jgi:hypothetical protein
MRRRALLKAVFAAGLIGLIASGTAYAIRADIGNISVSATATLLPRVLPKKADAPITLSSITRIGSHDGSAPATLERMEFLLDKNGSIETRGVPVCSPAKLADTTPQEARQRCAGALVGKGTGKALVTLPGRAPFQISSPLSFFNGPPTGGKPTIIAHAYETVPAAKTLLVPIVIEPVSKGRYGFQAKIQLPEIAAGYGSPILAEAMLGKTFKRGGKSVGYINAHCVGGRLQVHGTLTFTNGDFFPTTLTSPCHSPS